MVVTPASTPVTTGVTGPIVATAILLLVQTPPNTASYKVICDPTHTCGGPLIGTGGVLIVTRVVS